jgi:glutamate 5-kinase
VVIASGREPDVLVRLAGGEAIGTFFPATTTKLESRKRWMLSGLACCGNLVVDAGAVAALRQHNSSLLPAGVKDVEGEFERGDIVDILDAHGEKVACGISNYSSRDIAIIKGSHSDRINELLGYEYGAEVVHRNNLVVL